MSFLPGENKKKKTTFNGCYKTKYIRELYIKIREREREREMGQNEAIERLWIIYNEEVYIYKEGKQREKDIFAL